MSQTRAMVARTLSLVGTCQLQPVRAVNRGAVQGVGFRPFIYRLAEEMNLKGWVIK